MSGLVEGKREVILDFRKNPNSKELLDKLSKSRIFSSEDYDYIE